MDTITTMSNDLDHEAEKCAWAEDEANADAGRVVSHEVVAPWLKFCSTDHESPLPKCPG